VSGHTSRNRVNAETHVHALFAQCLGDLEHGVLSLGDGHTVTRDNHHFLGIRE